MAIPTKESEILTPQSSMGVIGWYKQIVNAFRQDPRLWFGVVLILYVIAAIFAPIISP